LQARIDDLDESKKNRKRQVKKRGNESISFEGEPRGNSITIKNPSKSDNETKNKKKKNKKADTQEEAEPEPEAEPEVDSKPKNKKKKNKKADTQEEPSPNDSSLNDSLVPTSLSSNVMKLSMSGNQKCMINKAGALNCWWFKEETGWTVQTPAGFESNTKLVSVGSTITCALNTQGVTCWRIGYYTYLKGSA